MCKQAWNVAFCEHNHTTVAESQQRVNSRDQARRSSQDCRSLNVRWMPVDHSEKQSFAAAALIATGNQRVKAARKSGTTASTSLRARW